jgi:hypothetical protein
MTVIAVPNEYTRSLEFPGARTVVSGLADGIRYLDI